MLFYYIKKYNKFVNENNNVIADIFSKSISPLVAFAKGRITANGWVLAFDKDGKTPHDVYGV